MLSRLLARAPNLRFLTLISSNKSHPIATQSSPEIANLFHTFRCFSSNRNNNGGDKFNKDPPNSSTWKLTPDDDEDASSIFGDLTGDIPGFDDEVGKGRIGSSNVPVDSWADDSSTSSDIFGGIDKEFEANKSASTGIGSSAVNVGSWGDESLESSDIFADIDANKSIISEGGDDWETAEGYKDWSFEEEEKNEVFDMSGVSAELPDIVDEVPERGKSEPDLQLEKEEKELSVQLKGPNRAFGDLIAASGITDAMLDSLIALKDLEGVEGLPPLSVIEDIRLEKAQAKNTRADMERQKQEEIAKSRVRRVDDKGRAYGTGRRKCSVARVFIQPGEGQFLVNDKQFDVYFPILDHRATLLSPFSETKTLGLWDIKCTVKGGGVSGQVGAIRLGISRALQNWEPGLRPNLRAAGFLTRDPRAVERKKPGKAKARKSFQWVKR